MATLTAAQLRELDRFTLHRLADELIDLQVRGLAFDEALHARVTGEVERRLTVGVRRVRLFV